MKKVVYFLGAGFSVPAGLPMISNFIFRAKDQYYSSPDIYPDFKSVFNYIDSLSKANNFTNVDLHNIEEVLSIAETHTLLDKSMKEDIAKFIKDVITFHTPKFEINDVKYSPNPNVVHVFFGSSHIQQYYISFFSALLNIVFEKYIETTQLEYHALKAVSAGTSDDYKIVTLNYDNLVENCVGFINKYFHGNFKIQIAKLHGSVDGNIVPPTWNKTIKGELDSDWKNAAKWLSDANEIRILGYSMPITDMYIKHLFSTSLLESNNLQKIDVICLDNNGQVKRRFDDMFTFPNYKFYNMDIELYLKPFIKTKFNNDYVTRQYNPEAKHEEAIKSYRIRNRD